MRETAFAPPLPLRQLAEITDFNLYVTTNFDPLLELAVNQVRFGGEPNTEVIAYAPNRVVDLPVERDDLQRPVVYHLLGRLSASPTYVISDEDVLEFICALQSEHLTPEKLFHALEHNHLLVIGSDFSNWLARLFLRMTKRRRLSDPRDVGEILADNHSLKDVRLVSFLQQVSVRTRMFSGAEEFVAELHRRWMARRGGVAAAANSAAPLRFPPPAREMPENAVFISYAREDLPAVQKLKAALDAAGVVTWFDMDRLESGDDYDRKIRGNIARCSFFIPVVSATTQRRHEGYFRREWSYAVDRTRGMADGAVFILPVCVDATAEADAIVPEKFKAVHFSRLPGGEAAPEFTRRLQEFFAARRA
jgi:TIR domain/SIR2-like domain